MVPVPPSGYPGTQSDRPLPQRWRKKECRGARVARASQLTPSFFCRLDDDVVYWNTSRLSGYT